jgi:hypothetical protein
MHALERDADLSKTLLDHLVVGLVGHSWIDDSDSAVVFEDVHVDVAETGHRDRQLGSQNPRGDFEDVLTRWQLFLFGRSGDDVGHNPRVVVTQSG